MSGQVLLALFSFVDPFRGQPMGLAIKLKRLEIQNQIGNDLDSKLSEFG